MLCDRVYVEEGRVVNRDDTRHGREWGERKESGVQMIVMRKVSVIGATTRHQQLCGGGPIFGHTLGVPAQHVACWEACWST